MQNSIIITAEEALENQLTKGGYEKLVRQNKQLQSTLRDTELAKDELTQKLDEMTAGLLLIAELSGVTTPIGADYTDLISVITEKLETLNIKES